MAATNKITEALIAFLQNPSSYPHHPPTVVIRQTHASVLAMAPPFVYKLKKHVNLGFLDFTQLQERKRNCERELELNSRFCADLYVAILPIAVKHEQLHFGSEGEVVDYALQMKQLKDGYFLDQLLQAGKVTRSLLEAVLKVLKGFYEKHPPEPFVAPYGDMEGIRKAAEENLDVLEQHTGNVVHPAALQAIRHYFQGFFEENQSLLAKRVQEHRIRDCHGDLHLDHIHIRKGKVCIYDCIEFNDTFRYIDVASDIAFLAMDLDQHERPDLSSYVTSRMIELLDDPDIDSLVGFYKCYRACVRAKVECIKAGEPEVPATEQEAGRERAKRHVRLALRYVLFDSVPAVLIVCGRSGCGKTTLAESFSNLLGWEHLSSDVVRKGIAGLPLYDRSSPTTRQGLYSLPVTDKVYQALLEETLEHVKKLRGVVVDATFSLAKHRALFGQALDKRQVLYYFLEMQTSEGVIRNRLAERDKSPKVVSDARLEDVDSLKRIYQAPVEVQPAHLVRVNADSDADVTLANALHKLSGLKRSKSGSASRRFFRGNGNTAQQERCP
ncbi:hypothetical protein CLV24_1249 [Pontibacter ummariensis]|uniref:Aminoglycoside phosphotransferase domain-containing protein n=1 Tax=Pontibacter ummariensis TaxID=1610492 RepID=A0A239JYC1_9BACT|nr:bifunctional aminoglycoside phosphotransferase/ATP-binding protein [Pontibacter ummariensis]PRY07271.1 hypothetical protein CLV24_1249 [Pontibacter ummariensis]SNT10765.1 hypothetical protein SAMN06296052_12455 [Pontibacter ummariensis]